MWFRKLGIFTDKLQDQQWNSLVRFIVAPRFGTETSYASVSETGNISAPSYSVTDMQTAPTSATATGVKGEIRFTSTHIYVCTDTNTWKRSALSAW